MEAWKVVLKVTYGDNKSRVYDYFTERTKEKAEERIESVKKDLINEDQKLFIKVEMKDNIITSTGYKGHYGKNSTVKKEEFCIERKNICLSRKVGAC